ncbi:hypothetical protein GCM10020258_22850 [Sphingomonas yabuuchiae]
MHPPCGTDDAAILPAARQHLSGRRVEKQQPLRPVVGPVASSFERDDDGRRTLFQRQRRDPLTGAQAAMRGVAIEEAACRCSPLIRKRAGLAIRSSIGEAARIAPEIARTIAISPIPSPSQRWTCNAVSRREIPATQTPKQTARPAGGEGRRQSGAFYSGLIPHPRSG